MLERFEYGVYVSGSLAVGEGMSDFSLPAAVAASAIAAPFLYHSIRSRFPATVNCWFCNQDSKVPYANRMRFVCPKCDQYNGFTEDGDYDVQVPGQRAGYMGGASSPAKRFCSTARPSVYSRVHGGCPDILPGGQFGNGLCDACNHSQELIMRKKNHFEPINEDRWQSELEDFEYRLNQLYPLCERCAMYSQHKTSSDKRRYQYLLDMKQRIAPTIVSAFTSVSQQVTRQIKPRPLGRRRFFSGGWVTVRAQATTLLMGTLTLFAYLHHILNDSDSELLPSLVVPPWLAVCLDGCVSVAPAMAAASLATHSIAMWNNKARVSFNDLALLPLLLALCGSHLMESKGRPDVLLTKLILSSLVVVVSLAVWVLPRKMRHRKRPNHFISSAFSVASTPQSQCSSQASRAASPFSPNRSMLATEQIVHETMTNQLTDRLARAPWRETEREYTPARDVGVAYGGGAKMATPVGGGGGACDMEWEPSEVNAPVSTTASMLRRRALAGHEPTPSRELGSVLSDLTLARDGFGGGSLLGGVGLGGAGLGGGGAGSVFAGSTASTLNKGFVAGTPTRTFSHSNSVFGGGGTRDWPSNGSVLTATAPSAVGAGTNPFRRGARSMVRGSPVRSEFSSISQRTPAAPPPPAPHMTYTHVIITVIFTVVSCLNAGMFWMMWKQHNK